MTWNYRVYKSILDDGSAWYVMHEAYYDKHISEPMWCTVRAVPVEGESVADLSKALGQMIEALDKDVLEYDKESGTSKRVKMYQSMSDNSNGE